MQKIIAVDFDGCLCVNKYPDIGAENELAISALLQKRAAGYKLILWTCRAGERLNEAVRWCRERGLDFDEVNENIPEITESFGGDCRKVYATEYWDDRAVIIKAGKRR